MKIQDHLSKRSDLSPFLVHLTRDHEGKTAKARLLEILTTQRLELGVSMGQAVDALNDKKISTDSQRCVCFTETPLESLKFMLGPIGWRTCRFEPYGIAILKQWGRENGVNPVWYLDITPGRDFLLTKSFNKLVAEAIDSGVDFDQTPISKLAPFVEQMGTNTREGGRTKEFSWEREWRSTSAISLQFPYLVLCPENEIEEFKKLVQVKVGVESDRFLDPHWEIERMIASVPGLT